MTIAIESERAAHGSHAYLHLLAVAPSAQKNGAGAALIEHVARKAAGPVYLETALEAHVAYYRRRGFELLRRFEPPGLPPLWSMLRSPRNFI